MISTCRADPIRGQRRTSGASDEVRLQLSEAEVREQIRLTVIHELGHYFGLDEEQLKDV